MRHLILVPLLVLLAAPAFGLDAVCDPNDPGYQPHDTADPYVRPNRDIRFCSSYDASLAELGPVLRCVATLDGSPYASAPGLEPGQEVTLTNPASGTGSLSVTCEYQGTDDQGQPALIVSQAVTVSYVPAPEPSAPVFLPSP